jgi:O-antigen/teichoic acid export membrane protein
MPIKHGLKSDSGLMHTPELPVPPTTMRKAKSLARKAIGAYTWSLLGEVASRTVGPVIFLMMARLLTPDDFGVVAAATVVISLSQVISDAGLGKALIQRQTEIGESANATFWLNLAAGIVIGGVIAAGAPFASILFEDARVEPVIRVMALQFPISAFSSVQTALMQKKLEFNRLFWVRLITTGVPGVAAAPLAVCGFGYWALVIGNLSGQVIQSAVLWMVSPWRPSRCVNPAATRELVAFGKWVMLSGLLAWFYGWVDTLVIGRFLGFHNMGVYRTGSTLVAMTFGLIFSPLLPVLYSLFARAQHNLLQLRFALETVEHAISLIALPIGFCLYAAGDLIAETALGPQWAGAGSVIGFMALMHSFSWIVGANGEVYRAIGKPHIETWVNAAMLTLYLPAYLVSVQYGLDVFVKTRFCLALAAMLAHIGVAWCILGIPPGRWLHPGILIASTAPLILTSGIDSASGIRFLDLGFFVISFFAISTLGTMFFERSFLSKIIRVVRSREI